MAKVASGTAGGSADPRAEPRPRTQPEINEYRRRALIEGTIDSLAEHGVAGTTVRTICAAAGTSRGLIAHYYASKEDLLVAALRQLFAAIEAEVWTAIDASGPSAVRRLKAEPAARFSPAVFTARNRDAFLSLWHEVRFNPAVRAANRALYRDYLVRTEALFREAAAEARTEIDPRRSAVSYIALTDGLWLGLSIDYDVFTEEDAVGECLRHIDRELGLDSA